MGLWERSACLRGGVAGLRGGVAGRRGGVAGLPGDVVGLGGGGRGVERRAGAAGGSAATRVEVLVGAAVVGSGSRITAC